MARRLSRRWLEAHPRRPPSRSAGHSHVVIEQIDKLESTTVTNSQNFAFFKGFNQAAVNGILSATVTGGLPAGVYKVRRSLWRCSVWLGVWLTSSRRPAQMSSINSAANHQPALIGVAQHGSLDDAVYFVRGFLSMSPVSRWIRAGPPAIPTDRLGQSCRRFGRWRRWRQQWR